MGPAQLLDVGGDVHGLDHGQVPGAVALEPGAEGADRGGVGAPGVGVADGDEEELEEAGGELGPGRGDHGRHRHLPCRDGDRRALDPDEAALPFHALPRITLLREITSFISCKRRVEASRPRPAGPDQVPVSGWCGGQETHRHAARRKRERPLADGRPKPAPLDPHWPPAAPP